MREPTGYLVSSLESICWYGFKSCLTLEKWAHLSILNFICKSVKLGVGKPFPEHPTLLPLRAAAVHTCASSRPIIVPL